MELDHACRFGYSAECLLEESSTRIPLTDLSKNQRSWDERSLASYSPQPPSRAENYGFRGFDNFDALNSPSKRSGIYTPRSQFSCEPNPMISEAWEHLRRSMVFFRKYLELHVFVRDFVPSALAFLMNGEPEIVKQFILKNLRFNYVWKTRFQWEKVWIASFQSPSRSVRILRRLLILQEIAIGRVALWILLNNIYRFKTEEYSHTAVNKFNIMPDSLPEWATHRILFLATPEQSTAIMDLIESRWEELVGEMPVKVCYPAIEGHEWRIVTGCDPKNTRWSYHNGGSWPVLLWFLTAACIKTGRPQIARRAIELAESRLSKDGWPEYYDGKRGRFIGKQSRRLQTWSIAGYLVAKMMLEDPSHLGMVALEDDKQLRPVLRRSASWTN
ncbi:hypothetical protein Leryth_007267 [Lithospermum erythrorhizon]|nr:hypothetical protein Leryth_007267 [Lithospermum erythrorhizon]